MADTQELRHDYRPEIAASIRALSLLTDAEVCACTAPRREQDGVIVACLRCRKVVRPDTVGLLKVAYALAPEGEA